MENKPRILLVEDTHSLAATYVLYLESLGDVLTSHSAHDARQAVIDYQPHLIILDLNLPDEPGQSVLAWVKQNHDCEVVIVTAHGSVDIAMEIMRLGAKDFLEKPVTADRLRTTAANCLENRTLKNTVNQIKKTLNRDHYHGFVGACLAIQAVYKTIDAAAPSTATVFITGESGTGKEVCAEAIKLQSPRSDKPFIAINCGAIPRDLIESELFGHIKGAFTGANCERKGAIQEAHKGTLFLDEIGEMPLDLQTKLLRFLQNSEVQKVGSSKVEKVDVRVICATNRDPFQEVEEGRFREDLYYRLNVLPLELPPLRDRGTDITLIANTFLQRFAKEENKKFKSLSPVVERVFLHYPWPGNIRQLQNVIRNIVVLHNSVQVEPEHLPPPLNHPKWLEGINETQGFSTASTPHAGNNLPASSNQQEVFQQTGNTYSNNNGGNQLVTGGAQSETLFNRDSAANYSPAASSDGQQINWHISDSGQIMTLAQIERLAIESVINMTEGNIPKAAALLDVSPSTIYRKKQAWERGAAH